ncbi:MAG: NADH-quinone oxidoreductase subunit C [Pirellulales bacterium]|nr:NADH-quinone oxidoreductase subunit C [Pirellulales bacterium]
MSETLAAVEALKKAYPGVAADAFRGQQRLVAPAAAAHDVLRALKEEHGFDFLADITCVDYLDYPGAADRYGVVYVLVNTATSARLVVRARVNDPEPTVRSVVDLWAAADWLEREVWDLFGIRFEGHPDPRRLVLPDAFEAHPLRKDYPLQGHGERHNHPVVTRENEEQYPG